MPAIATMPAGREGSTVAVMVFSRESKASTIAQPKKTKLASRLATVADVKANGPYGR